MTIVTRPSSADNQFSSGTAGYRRLARRLMRSVFADFRIGFLVRRDWSRPMAGCNQLPPGVNTGPVGGTWKLRRGTAAVASLCRNKSLEETADPASSRVAMSMIAKDRLR